MADRSFYTDQGSLSRRLVTITGAFVTGATGAVASQDFDAATITRTAVGRYNIQLGTAAKPDKYPKLRAVMPTMMMPGALPANSTGLLMTVWGNTVATTGIITVQFFTSNGTACTAAELDVGMTVAFVITLKNCV